MMPNDPVRLADDVRFRLRSKPPARSIALERRIDEVWTRMCATRPELHDGSICTLERVSPSEIVLGRARFRDFVAQRSEPVLQEDLGIVAVGVSGVVRVGARILLGRRALVSEHRGKWELVPSGHLPPDHDPPDVGGHLIVELEEEAGIPANRVVAVRPFALIPDPKTATADVCARIEIDIDPDELDATVAKAPRKEYDKFRMLTQRAAAKFRTHSRTKVVPTSEILLNQFAAEIWAVDWDNR